MYCPKCGKENIGDDNFCIFCGEDLGLYKNRENLQGINMKPNPGYGDVNGNDYSTYNYSGRPADNSKIQLASLGSRIGAYLIDMVIIFVLVTIILIIIDASQVTYISDDTYGLLAILVYLSVFFGYFILLEGPLGKGRTAGKIVFKLRVVKKEDQSTIDYGKSFVRNILRLVDGLPFLYIIGMILISDSDLNQRLGDKAADTIVIKGRGYTEDKVRSIYY